MSLAFFLNHVVSLKETSLNNTENKFANTQKRLIEFKWLK